MNAVLPQHTPDKTLEVWWQDGRAQVTPDTIGQQGTLNRIWVERDSRPAAPRDQR